MGEIADMILDGLLCESCGSATCKEPGYPIKCEDCQEDGE